METFQELSDLFTRSIGKELDMILTKYICCKIDDRILHQLKDDVNRHLMDFTWYNGDYNLKRAFLDYARKGTDIFRDTRD